jgi:hypothetical protein
MEDIMEDTSEMPYLITVKMSPYHKTNTDSSGGLQHFLALAENEMEAIEMVKKWYEKRPCTTNQPLDEPAQFTIKLALEAQMLPGKRLFFME